MASPKEKGVLSGLFMWQSLRKLDLQASQGLHPTRRWQEEGGPGVRHDPLAWTSAWTAFEWLSVAS